jgi:hypothetical protein
MPPKPGRGLSVILEDDSDDFEDLEMEGDWAKVDGRRDVDPKSGLSVPRSKEDPLYEQARRRYKPVTPCEENDFVKAGKAFGAFLGISSSFDEQNTNRPITHTRHASSSNMDTRAARQTRPTVQTGAEKLNIGVFKPPPRSSDSVKELGEPAGSIQAGVSNNEQPLLPQSTSKPVHDILVESADDATHLKKLIKQLALSDADQPKRETNSGLPGDAVPSRRGRKPSTTTEDKAKHVEEVQGSQQLSSRTKQTTESGENHRGRASARVEPIWSKGHNTFLQLYRERARSANSAKWSSSSPKSSSSSKSSSSDSDSEPELSKETSTSPPLDSKRERIAMKVRARERRVDPQKPNPITPRSLRSLRQN